MLHAWLAPRVQGSPPVTSGPRLDAIFSNAFAYYMYMPADELLLAQGQLEQLIASVACHASGGATQSIDFAHSNAIAHRRVVPGAPAAAGAAVRRRRAPRDVDSRQRVD